MKHHIRSALLALVLLSAGLVAACTPGGSGATSAPGGGGAAPASTVPAPDASGKGGYSY